MMPLDPQAKKLLDVMNGTRTRGFHEIGAKKAREYYNARPANLAPAWVDVFKVGNQTIEHQTLCTPVSIPLSIPIRIYTPVESISPLPVCVFYHGGGMVIGSLDSYDTLCRQLSIQSGCIIVSVDYRLAPENKFPAAVDDAFAALDWVSQYADSFNGDSNNLMVAGDSAGGTLAAVVALIVRDHPTIKLKFQLLIYPALAAHADSESHHKFAKGYFLERLTILWFQECYMQTEADRQDFRYAPLSADDFSGLPPALVMVADHDPLRDEGVEYTKRLKASGVDVELQEYEGMIHPFLSLAGILDQGRQAITLAANALSNASR
ncbi:MAG: acetyl esterase [Cellvibrionaceae bacterium]|jgi:acetyl esterase